MYLKNTINLIFIRTLFFSNIHYTLGMYYFFSVIIIRLFDLTFVTEYGHIQHFINIRQ